MNNHRVRMLSVWAGIGFFVLWGSGLAITGWIIPLPPYLEAPAVAELVQSRPGILLGAAIMTLTACLYLPWTVLLSSLIKPVEAPSNILSQTQLVAGVMAQVTFFIPPYMWATAAYRPFRSPEITQAFIDAGYLMFITGIGPFLLQYGALAVAIFSDKREIPAYPRWLGFLQIWICVSFLPAIIPFFIKKGPFAWNGLFAWWLPLTLFSAWAVAMIVLTRKAVLRGL